MVNYIGYISVHIFMVALIQPENILLDGKQKVVKISDFGFSTNLPEEGLSGGCYYRQYDGILKLGGHWKNHLHLSLTWKFNGMEIQWHGNSMACLYMGKGPLLVLLTLSLF